MGYPTFSQFSARTTCRHSSANTQSTDKQTDVQSVPKNIFGSSEKALEIVKHFLCRICMGNLATMMLFSMLELGRALHSE